MKCNSENYYQKVNISPVILNNYISDMLTSARGKQIGYYTQFDVIKSAFESCRASGLGILDIKIRLSLIDLFYTTNFNRFAEFGLDKLALTIWNLCKDVSGNHSDAELVRKSAEFVAECCNQSSWEQARNSEIYKDLFSAKFGLVHMKENGEPEKYSAQSLISKYLYFLSEVHPNPSNPLGFPIYDSLAKDVQGGLVKKLCKGTPAGSDMVTYIFKMHSILEKLVAADTTGLWEMPSKVSNTQFGLLDYFLWRIGKSGQFSFSLLWTKAEKAAHYQVAHNLSKALKKKPVIDKSQFLSLPSRFQYWHIIYKSIKE